MGRRAGDSANGVVIADRTFLLTDIEGSTPLWERYATLMDEILRRHDDIIAASVAREGGRLIREKGEGDSTFSVFDDPSAAVLAAIEAQRALASERWPGAIPIGVRMGIHSGESVERDEQYYGSTVNRTARIRGLARGGQILLSNDVAVVARRLPAGIRLVDIGRHVLRGLAQPEAVFLVDDPACTSNSERDLPPLPADLRATGLFIGREEVVLDALSHVEKAFDDGGTVVVTGPAGIGKSALVAQVAGTLHQSGVLVLGARCSPQMREPYAPLGALLGPAVDLIGPRIHDDARAALAAVGTTEVAAATVLEHVEREAACDAVFDGVRSFLAAVAADHRVVVVVDDMHWAGDDARRILDALSRSPVRGVALVAASRGRDVVGGRAVAVELAPLERADVQAIVEAYDALAPTGREDAPTTPAVVDALLAATAGSPFLLTELLSTTGSVGRSLAPGADVVATRFEQLSASGQQVLDAAAVVGPTFTLARVEELVPPDTDAFGGCEELLEHGHAVEVGPGRYRFAHDLVLAAAKARVPRERQGAWHARLAAALQRCRAPEHEIVDHWLAAAERDAELPDEVAADLVGRVSGVAQDATRRFAFGDAHAILERAWAALAEKLGPSARCDLGLAVGEGRRGVGDIDGERAVVTAVADAALASADGPRIAQTAVALATHGTVGVPDLETTRFCEAALTVVHDDAAARSRIYSALAFHDAVYAGRRDDGLRHSAEALRLAREAEDDVALANALSTSAAARVGAPDAEAQLALARELRAIAARRGDPVLAERALRIEGPVMLQIGDRAGFDESRRRLRQLGEQYRHWFWRATATQWDAMAALLAGDFQGAEAAANQLLTFGHRDSDVVNVFGAQLLLIREEQGRLEEVLPIAVAAVSQNPGLAAFRVALAAAYAELGDIEQSRLYFESFARDGFASVPMDVSRSGSLALLAQACSVVGTEEAAACLHEMLLPFEHQLIVLAAGIACLGAGDRFLAMLSGRLGDADTATARYEGALELEEAIAARPLAVRTRARWAQAILDGEATGTLAQARLLADAARTAADELGMAGVVAAADRILQRVPPAGPGAGRSTV